MTNPKKKSTPFARWRENNEPDPHGDLYTQGVDIIAMGKYPHETIALALAHSNFSFSFIHWLTAGKERLRWLSRKLYQLTNDHQSINQERATLAKGDLTDDELANEFYLSESKEDLQAGHDRILWLSEKINQITLNHATHE